MNCWETLDLAPDADEKKIKLAYSKLLKITRPDEDPEGFQRLRQAYKSALDEIKFQATQSNSKTLIPVAETSESDTINETTKTSSEVVFKVDGLKQPAAAKNKVDIATTGTESDWAEFIETAERYLQLPTKINSVNDWKELISASILVDLQYRQAASERIFCLVADANLDTERPPELSIHSNTLKYLVDEFQWETQRYNLLDRFGSERADAVFENLDEQSVDKSFKWLGLANSLLSLIVIALGFYGVFFWAVVLLAAIPSTARRVYVRQWQRTRQGFSNGGSTEALGENQAVHVALIYIAMCIAEAFSYGIGWLLRIAIS